MMPGSHLSNSNLIGIGYDIGSEDFKSFLDDSNGKHSLKTLL